MTKPLERMTKRELIGRVMDLEMGLDARVAEAEDRATRAQADALRLREVLRLQLQVEEHQIAAMRAKCDADTARLELTRMLTQRDAEILRRENT